MRGLKPKTSHEKLIYHIETLGLYSTELIAIYPNVFHLHEFCLKASKAEELRTASKMFANWTCFTKKQRLVSSIFGIVYCLVHCLVYCLENLFLIDLPQK